MLSPGTAYLLAYLPARRAAHIQRLGLFDRHAASVDTSLQHGIEFSRQLRAEESRTAEVEARLADLTCQARIDLPAIPRTASELQPWLAALSERVRPCLTTPVHEAAWKAGETARRIAVAVALSAYAAYLRYATPADADLRAEAEDCARDLKDSASMLTVDLKATGLPLVISQADNVAEMVSLTRDLTPTTIGGYRKLYMLVGDLHMLLEGKARQLDVAPPPKASSPPSAEEEALLARIIATPHDLRLRLELAALAERRNDPRGTLINLQLTGIEDDDADKASDLISSHPEWTARLEELGARDIKFGAGFPDAITVDAAVLLSQGAELFATAPLRRLRVRAAKGRVGEIVRLPLLATLDSLDLDNQAVTDDDVIALASSPHAARLRQLDLRHNPITARGIEALAASPHLKKLLTVNLDGNPADPVDRLEYYDETNQHAVPTDAGKALEAKYGPLRWLHRG